jgi:hypothetical protein
MDDLTYRHHRDTLKAKLALLFKSFRQNHKLVARQNFLDSGSSGVSQIASELEAGEFEGKQGFVFYHHQDNRVFNLDYFEQNEREDIGLYLCHGTLTKDDTEANRQALGQVIAREAEVVGLGVKWDGHPDNRIYVFVK